ncbi:MAG: hypothetical protein A3F90_06785 [Deltaproteobacteria bacterium RIFCSPLOWO2_12_FULL_60_19]|nr:MAG: hypothetical protein A3F90_06785 [Deltaproteobacteria bacterium RIFCSPLOWO2_12_FULL_60_19]
MSFARFQIRKHKVLHQMIDGEVVIINLDTGNYYSLRGTGAALWSAVEHGAAIREIVGALARKYQAAADVLERSVADFVEQLQREGLIEACGDGSDLEELPPAAEETSPGRPVAFEPPTLEKYEDMQDLILLDPVHEVDEEKGWPYAKRPGKPDPKP